MRTITEQLVELAGGDFVQQPEVSDPSQKYSMFNDGGVTCEDGEFLFGFVRQMKPEHVLETGTHRGVGMAYMASALKANGSGFLDTVEFLPPHANYCKGLLEKLELTDYAKVWEMDATKFVPKVTYDIVFLDTEPQTRFTELVQLYGHVAPGGFIFIHDLHRHMHQNQPIHPDHPNEPDWPYGRLPEHVNQLVRDGKLRPFHFSTPRGLTGFYKVHPGDHKWD